MSRLSKNYGTEQHLTDHYVRHMDYQVLLPQQLFDELEAEALREEESAHRQRERSPFEDDLRAFRAQREQSPATQTQPKGKRKTRMVQIFNPEDLKAAKEHLKKDNRERREKFMHLLALAERDDGKRQLPRFTSIEKKLQQIGKQFPNFQGVLEAMSVELTIAAKVRPENFIFAPILMNGVPGIGKTAFAQAIADAFKLPFLKLAAGGLQGNFRIVGSAAHWGNTEVGDIYRLLSNSEFATGVILLDEVDKVGSDQRFNAIPALLELLEAESARMLKDESLCVRMDASKLIILATSNYMEQIEPALLSRLQIHEIAPPTPEQKKYIAERLFQKLTRETKSDIALDAKSLSKFVQQPIDLRLLGRAVRSAFARATAANSKVAFMPAIQSNETARKIGFV